MAHKIESLTVTNYKGINGTITLKPTGSLVVIAGANGSGKSSFIDAIAEIFDPKGTRITARPIHDGADTATAELITDDARLVRVWNKNDAGTLTAYALDGAKYASGKDFVLKATGGTMFDPTRFVSMSGRDQRAALLALVDLPFDLDALDADRAAAFDARTAQTREVKQLAAQLAGHPERDATVSDVEVSAAVLVKAYNEARDENDRSEATRKWHASAAADVDATVQELDRLAALLGDLMVVRDNAALIAADLPAPADLPAMFEGINNAEEFNARVRAQKARAMTAAALDQATLVETGLTADIATIDAAKRAGLAAAVFPVPGLAVTDDGITLAGIPFGQVNTAAQIATAFDIATAGQPDLRLVIIKDGDLLDADTLAAIGAQADARGYVVLVERDRDESRAVGFTIADGQIIA